MAFDFGWLLLSFLQQNIHFRPGLEAVEPGTVRTSWQGICRVKMILFFRQLCCTGYQTR